MLFNIPLSLPKADRIIDLLDLPSSGRVLDAGCGTGEFLIRLIERWNCTGLGIDLDEKVIESARVSAETRLKDGSCEFVATDINSIEIDEKLFNLAICLGATHAFAVGEPAYATTLTELMKRIQPAGRILVGDGYWKQPPDPQYVKFIGEPVGIYRSHAQNIQLAESLGLNTLYALVSSSNEWDHFEWSHRMKIEQLARQHGDDLAWGERLKQKKDWCAAYLNWGRETMGFGFYLFEKPR